MFGDLSGGTFAHLLKKYLNGLYKAALLCFSLPLWHLSLLSAI